MRGSLLWNAPPVAVMTWLMIMAGCTEERQHLPSPPVPVGTGGAGGPITGTLSSSSGIVGTNDATMPGDPSGGCQGGAANEAGPPDAWDLEASAPDAEIADTAGSEAQVITLVPLLRCVRHVDATQFEALFGYENDGARRRVAIGPDNRFAPDESGRGQPEVFELGRTAGAFAVRFDGAPITWTLTGQAVTASATSPPCGADPCNPACFEGEACVDGTCVTECGDTLCAGDEDCRTCAADCACADGQVCFADACANPARCGIDWSCGCGKSFGVFVDCGRCDAGACVAHVCR